MITDAMQSLIAFILAQIYLVQRFNLRKLSMGPYLSMRTLAWRAVWFLGALMHGMGWGEAVRVGYNSKTSNYGAISLALEEAQRDGLLAGENIRYVTSPRAVFCEVP